MKDNQTNNLLCRTLMLKSRPQSEDIDVADNEISSEYKYDSVNLLAKTTEKLKKDTLCRTEIYLSQQKDENRSNLVEDKKTDNDTNNI